MKAWSRGDSAAGRSPGRSRAILLLHEAHVVMMVHSREGEDTARECTAFPSM